MIILVLCFLVGVIVAFYCHCGINLFLTLMGIKYKQELTDELLLKNLKN